MEASDVSGAGPRDEDIFGFSSRRQGSSKPSHRRTVSSPVVHDFLRGQDSMYSSSGPFGALGDTSNGLFSPRLAVGSKGHHRESASGDYLTVSTEAGDTSYASSMDSLFHRGGLESLRSDFLKMDLGKRRISEDERERVSHHSNATDSADGGVVTLSRSLGAATGDARTVVSSSDSALHLLGGSAVSSGSGGLSSSGRRPPSAGPSMDSSAASSVGVSSVLGGPGGGSGGASGGGGGVGANGGGGGGDGSRGGMVSGSSTRGPSPTSSHEGHHRIANGGSGQRSGSGGGGGGGGGGNRGGEGERDRTHGGGGGGGGGSGGGGGFRGQGGGGRTGGHGGGGQGGGSGGQAWIRTGGGGGFDDGYPNSTFGYRDPLSTMPGGGPGTQQQQQQSGGMPMAYAVHSDGYSTVPLQPTYAMNGGDTYSQGVNHVRPNGPAHGSGLDGGAIGDQQLLPQNMPAMGSPPQPPMPTPQQVYMPAQGTYVVAGADDGRSNGVSSASGSGGGGGGGGGGSVSGAHMQPMLVYQQGGNAQQGQQGPGADQAASQMFLPMSQAGYGYVPQMSHLPAGGVPVYQMAGAALDGGAQPSTRSNGVASGSGGGGGSGGGSGGGAGGGNSNGGNGRTSPVSPTLASPQSGAPPPQSFQVHYAITPQGIVPMVPVMPNGAGGFTNPALYANLGGMYDDGRGGMAGMAGMPVPGGMINDAGPGGAGMMDKGRISPPLGGGPPPSSSSLHPRFTGSSSQPPPPHHHQPPPHPHMQHTGNLQHHQQHHQPMHAPAWSVGGGGVHDPGGPMGYPDAGLGIGYNDGVYRGGGVGGVGPTGPGQDMFRGVASRTPREGDAGKDVKDRRKRLDRESDMAALLEATRPALKDVLGKVYSMSRDQVGCRLLQQKLDECPDRPPEGDAGSEPSEDDAVSAIFMEALPNLSMMMIDPFGNYLFQKLFVKVDDHQRLLAVEAVTDRMPEAAVNLHGTRCVQKVVELCRTDAQAAVIARSLGPSVVRLSLDPNGNHVVQRALQHMPAPRNDFVLEAITASLVQVAVHRHGCCVLQRCLDAAGPNLRIKLIDEVARNGLRLMQDPFGNYVVQYVLKTCSREETFMLCSAPLGHVASLSTQKFSSNVMEACLERALPEVQSKFVEELAQQGRIRELILDQYANYVVQRALTVANNEEGLKLVNAIRPHLHSMQSTSSGRRIAAKIIKRYPTVDLGEEILMLMSRG